MNLRGLYGSWRQSRRRKGRVDDHEVTDPGDAATQAALAALDAALPARLNVVGNARSLLDRTYGATIDDAATIRFNKAQITQPPAQGTRWDFVASSDPGTLDYYQTHAPQFHTLLFTPYYDLHLDRLAGRSLGVTVLSYPLRLSIELMALLEARPTTGAQILFLLDRLGRRDVGVFGFDWKASPTFYHSARTRDPHNHFREMRQFRRMIRTNGWTLHG